MEVLVGILVSLLVLTYCLSEWSRECCYHRDSFTFSDPF